MNLDKISPRKQAWELAHKLICLGKIVTDKENMDMLHVSTKEITKAMGKPEDASMEEVKQFVFNVIEFMKGYGLYISCGCGYLFIRVTTEKVIDKLMESARDITVYTPDNLENYFNETILNIADAKIEMATTCDIGDITKTLEKI